MGSTRTDFDRTRAEVATLDLDEFPDKHQAPRHQNGLSFRAWRPMHPSPAEPKPEDRTARTPHWTSQSHLALNLPGSVPLLTALASGEEDAGHRARQREAAEWRLRCVCIGCQLR